MSMQIMKDRKIGTAACFWAVRSTIKDHKSIRRKSTWANHGEATCFPPAPAHWAKLHNQDPAFCFHNQLRVLWETDFTSQSWRNLGAVITDLNANLWGKVFYLCKKSHQVVNSASHCTIPVSTGKFSHHTLHTLSNQSTSSHHWKLHIKELSKSAYRYFI